jgi:hypothetical protein
MFKKEEKLLGVISAVFFFNVAKASSFGSLLMALQSAIAKRYPLKKSCYSLTSFGYLLKVHLF